MSQYSKLNDLFQRVLHTSILLISSVPGFDGREFWQPIKMRLSRYDNFEALNSWKELDKDFIEQVSNMDEFTVNEKGEKTLIEVNHFLIQQYRIPTTETPNIRKILQIALNVGQYFGSFGDTTIKTSENMLLSTFITDEDIKYLSEIIDDDTYSFICNYLKTQLKLD